MQKWLFFSLVVLICSVLFQLSPVKAESSSVSTISLEEGNIILPNSDVELISAGKERFYAQVTYQGKSCLYLSENKGRTWQKSLGQGLPDGEKFIALGTLAGQPEIVVLTTRTKVYLSRNAGQNFEFLGGPSGLTDRGEEITSLTVTGGPKIAVGVWHPATGKFAEEGVFLWNWGGKAIWEGQNMRPSWRQGDGYSSDVTSVTFFLGTETLLVLATGDPDGPEPLPEGSYLNIAYPAGETTQWNDFLGWPIEVAQTAGQSPNEAEILSSKIAFSEFDRREEKIYVIYNTRQRVKDDVYLIKISEGNAVEEVRKLGVPKNPEIISLDSVDYSGNSGVGFLAVGITTIEGSQDGGWGGPGGGGGGGGAGIIDGAHVYYLSSTNERFSPPSWENRWLRSGGYNTYNCQVAISEGVIFAGTSGPASSFSRAEENTLLPISLIDASPGIDQLSLSIAFREDGILYFNYGNRNLLRLILKENYQLKEAARVFYYHQGFDQGRIKIGPASNKNLFLFETRTKRFWLSKDGGLNWLPAMEKEVEITDARVSGDKVWVAGKDGLIYLCQNTGATQSRISSGLAWIGRIELGPEGKILVAGGSKEWFFETISIVGEESYQVLPPLPVVTSSSEGYKLGYSLRDNSIYCGVNNQLYRTVVGANSWEKVAEFGNWVNEILVSPQGLYVFIKPQVYFSHFPVKEGSQWTQVGKEELKGTNWLGCRLAEVDEKENLLILWDVSKITVFSHQPGEKPKEEISSPPVTPETVKPKPATSTPTPAPTTTPKLPSTQPPVQIPSIDWSIIWMWIAIGLVVLIGTFVLIAILAK